MPLLVLGSVALDTLETERGSAERCLGGSASYAALAAHYFVRPTLLGIVGDDFPDEDRAFLAERVDLSELAVAAGEKTFHWHGRHSLATGETTTLRTEVNAYERFAPRLSPAAAELPYALLGNIQPALQSDVLSQLRNPRFVASDTMSLWIQTEKDALVELARRVDLFLLNEEEARELTGRTDARACGEALLEMGIKRVIVKRGARPALLMSEQGRREVPSYPDVDLVDPTGAGDSFAGALMGYLASRGVKDPSLDTLAEAMRYGAAAASYTIERFGAKAHAFLTRERLEDRLVQAASA